MLIFFDETFRDSLAHPGVTLGALVGAAVMDEIPIWFKETKAPVNIGHLFGAIDIERFAGADVFRERLLRMIVELKERCSEEGVCRVCLPGEVEEGIEAERRKRGVPASLTSLTPWKWRICSRTCVST